MKRARLALAFFYVTPLYEQAAVDMTDACSKLIMWLKTVQL